MKIENCEAPCSIQPLGLVLSDDNTHFICDNCAGIWVTDDNGYCTDTCDVEQCTFCATENECTACAAGYLPFITECIPSGPIAYCDLVNSTNSS